MINGIKTTSKGDLCAYCNTKINADIYNFCPKCGNALNKNAIDFREQQNKSVKIDLLDELSSEINDENSLKIIIEKLKNI